MTYYGTYLPRWATSSRLVSVHGNFWVPPWNSKVRMSPWILTRVTGVPAGTFTVPTGWPFNTAGKVTGCLSMTLMGQVEELSPRSAGLKGLGGGVGVGSGTGGGGGGALRGAEVPLNVAAGDWASRNT